MHTALADEKRQKTVECTKDLQSVNGDGIIFYEPWAEAERASQCDSLKKDDHIFLIDNGLHL